MLSDVLIRGDVHDPDLNRISITVGEVVRLTEPSLQPADCASCVLRHGCGLIPVLDCALRAFMEVLDGRTLADALKETSLPFRRLASNPF